jgi:hypothetical protein
VSPIVQQYIGEVVPCANPATIFVFHKFDKKFVWSRFSIEKKKLRNFGKKKIKKKFGKKKLRKNLEKNVFGIFWSRVNLANFDHI